MVESLASSLTWQPSLLDGELESGVDGGTSLGLDRSDGQLDADFASLVRHQLDACCWVDHASGWLRGSDSLFEQLLCSGAFRQRERWMYERMVDEPRLVAPWPLEQLPPVIDMARRLLSSRYDVEFDSVLVNLYRDGRDSVAWHGDTVRKTQSHPMVVTISLGARRRFLLRPRGGGTSLRWLLGPGDLVVMGGRSQHDWEHCVPKMALAGPRASVTMRHSQPITATRATAAAPATRASRATRATRATTAAPATGVPAATAATGGLAASAADGRRA